MRNLTVKRKWSIVECGSKIRLFVQCPKEQATCTIEEKYFIEYRLKNGKTVVAPMLEDETAVFVESSTMSVSFTVPAGTNDVSLLAKPSYNPAQGNPFTLTEIK